MSVTVYSRPNCCQCVATISTFSRQGVECEVINIDENEEARNYVESTAIRNLPVVALDGMTPWGGFQPDMITQAICKLQTA